MSLRCWMEGESTMKWFPPAHLKSGVKLSAEGSCFITLQLHLHSKWEKAWHQPVCLFQLSHYVSMTLAALSARLFLKSNRKKRCNGRVIGAQAARESRAINQSQFLVNMTQKSAVAPGLIWPELFPRLWQKVLPLPCCVCSHSHHPLLHLFTRLVIAGTYARSHPRKFGEKLNHLGGVCVCAYVCVHVREILGWSLFSPQRLTT